MIYELRVYQPVPGQMPKLLARFRDKLLPISRLGVRGRGAWFFLLGLFFSRSLSPAADRFCFSRKPAPRGVAPGLVAGHAIRA
jgi:hypothetical protein